MAYATLLSCDPDAEVDGVKLGNQFWKLRITFPIEENEVLVRPWHHYKTIGDAKGKKVTWPSTFVCLSWLALLSMSYLYITRTYTPTIYCCPCRLKRLMVEFSIWIYSSPTHQDEEETS